MSNQILDVTSRFLDKCVTQVAWEFTSNLIDE